MSWRNNNVSIFFILFNEYISESATSKYRNVVRSWELGGKCANIGLCLICLAKFVIIICQLVKDKALQSIHLSGMSSEHVHHQSLPLSRQDLLELRMCIQ